MTQDKDLFPREMLLAHLAERVTQAANDAAANVAKLAMQEIGDRSNHANRCIGQRFRRIREQMEGVNHA